MKKWALLAAAIAAEVTGTLMLRAAVDQPLWTVGVVVSYLLAFTLIALTLRTGMPIGAVYGIWGATGVALVALLAVLVFNEPLSVTSWIGIGVIACGVILVETGTRNNSPDPQGAAS